MKNINFQIFFLNDHLFLKKKKFLGRTKIKRVYGNLKKNPIMVEQIPKAKISFKLMDRPAKDYDLITVDPGLLSITL